MEAVIAREAPVCGRRRCAHASVAMLSAVVRVHCRVRGWCSARPGAERRREGSDWASTVSPATSTTQTVATAGAQTTNVDEMLMKKKAGQELTFLTSFHSVELPGIEPAPKMVVTCGNVEFDYAKRLESRSRWASQRSQSNCAPCSGRATPQARTGNRAAADGVTLQHQRRQNGWFVGHNDLSDVSDPQARILATRTSGGAGVDQEGEARHARADWSRPSIHHG